ncbi:MAG: UDP-N-acetylmuramoyl-L-alanyl-D-glutamate--2,6-diaminopimelate ligase [Terrimicrobiaceae bacterium]
MSVPFASLLDSTEVVSRPFNMPKEITGLCYDSRKAGTGHVFFALRGMKEDGGAFVRDAVSRGASVVVAEQEIPEAGVPVVIVADARASMADMASTFYGKPSESLKVVGITGTNGKTTTAFLTRHILDTQLRRTGLVGTIKYVVAEREMDAPRTTPESIDLQALLSEMRDAGCKAVAMEVSSHAIHQKRSRAIEFDAAVFTNLTQDHLDYHGTMDAYFEAKAALFDSLCGQKQKKGRAIINADDRYGHLLTERISKKLTTITFGLGVRADFRATDVRFDSHGSTFHLAARGRTYLVRFPLIGAFNIYNALAALAASFAVGTELRAAVTALASAPQVPGRLERVPAKRNFQVFVDYAHTDDALRNVLRTLRELNPARLIVVVGCGGDRDRAKRPLMAAVSENLADWCIFTSDNPRSEDPDRILADMKAGLRGTNHELIADREEAIERAVELAEARDIILIAGKGHETYQEFADGRVPFDDVKVAKKVIDSRRIELAEEERL